MEQGSGARHAPLAPSTMPTAFVIGIDCITGLQTARLLAARGIPVVGIATDPAHFCAQTRVCREIMRADTASLELIEVLEANASRFGTPPILIPCTDASVAQISEQRDRLRGYRFALPDHDVVEMLLHKPTMTRYAQSEGFRIPASVEVGDRAQLCEAMETLHFPCVLKPAVKDARWMSNTSAKAFEAADAEALLRIFETCATWSDRFIVQEWIEGPESELYSCNCCFSIQGEPIATFVARKIRQWPPETGTSALGVECRSDVVRDETLRLFQGVGYRGLGYVEMKFDRRSGNFFLIEPNVGRPTGRSAIAEAGGVELLHAMYCDLAGLPLPAQLEQRFGSAKWIYLRHDLQAAFHAWRRGRLGLSEWWKSLQGPKAYAVLSFRDPLPFLFDLIGTTRKALRQLRARGGGRALAGPSVPGHQEGTTS